MDQVTESSVATEETTVTNEATLQVPRKNMLALSSSLDTSTGDAVHKDDKNDELGVVLRPQRRNVSFGNVSCRLYERTAGLHPDCSSGPPLTFNWNYENAPDMHIDEYEAVQGKRLTRTQLIIPKRERSTILMREGGLSRTTIAAHVRKTNQFKAQRRQTIENLRYEKVEEKFQKLCRGVSRLLFCRKSNTVEMEHLWKSAEKLHLDNSANTASTTSTSASLSERMPLRSNLKDIYKKKFSHEALGNNGGDDDDAGVASAANPLDSAHHRKHYDLFSPHEIDQENCREEHLYDLSNPIICDNTVATPRLRLFVKNESNKSQMGRSVSLDKAPITNVGNIKKEKNISIPTSQ